MKRVVTILFLVILLLSNFKMNVFAEEHIPTAYYDKYGDLGEEIYYDELGLLAYLVYAEAGNQDLKGKELVADIVLNRVNDERFPDTISEVIYQEGQFYPKGSKRLDWAARNVTDECYEAVKHEIDFGITDPNIFFYSAGYYQSYGTPAYKYGDHYFNYF